MKRYASLALLLFLPLLAGCASPGLYGVEPGLYAIGHADGLVLRDAAQPRNIPFRVAYPETSAGAPGRYPVVLPDPPDAFSGLTLPLIATGGTLDVGNTGGPVVHPWEWRMSPYTLAPAGNKYSVVLENADHYLGGLICRPDRGGDDDPEGVAIDGALTLAFLDAYVKQEPKAVRFLATADITALTAGRARFARK